MRRWRARACCVIALIGGALALASPAAALAPDGQHGWVWQMPQPVGDLSAVTFATAADVWAVGAGGAILHSTDAGATWASTPSGTDADLWSVSFADAGHGWACGYSADGSGVVVATTDGGTWTDRTPAGSTAMFLNVSFAGDDDGWVGTDGGAVLATTDGGLTWTTVKVGTYKGDTVADLLDAGHGWVGGTKGRIWRTTNGGASWTAETTGFASGVQVEKLVFVDRLHGWALGETGDWDSTVLRVTSDGGRHWRAVPHASLAAGDVAVTGQAKALLLSSDTSEPLGGFQYAASGVLNQTTLFLRTADTGRLWHRAEVAAPFTLWAVAARGDAVCCVGDGILTSSDGGATWRGASSGQDYEVTSADAVSPTDIWAVESGGALLHSTDGARWAEPAAAMSPVRRWLNALAAVSFPDASDGWVVGQDANLDGVILHTTDGGDTWTPQASQLGGPLQGVQFVDATHGWAVTAEPGAGSGSNDAVERTTDGGDTWVPQFVANMAVPSSVDFTSDDAGCVAGGYIPNGNGAEVPAIFRTTDGGQSWTRTTVPLGAHQQGVMWSLSFPDPDDGWAVEGIYSVLSPDSYEETAAVLHSTDGGATWASVAALADLGAQSVHFSDSQHGWVGASEGVYETTDGGDDWQQVAGGDVVSEIAAADPQHVWAFGYESVVAAIDAAAGDTAAPLTLVEGSVALPRWHRGAVTIPFTASDTGGAGLDVTQSSVDGGAWTPGAAVTLPAPASHADDGLHTVLYRSSDLAGNVEQTESLTVAIDTAGPVCTAPANRSVDSGGWGILHFKATDRTSGVARAVITVLDSRGRVAKRFVERAGDWEAYPVPAYFWLRFRCTLAPGRYRVEVRATDVAGNPQQKVGRGVLRVVAAGAPPASRPWWPAGLPGTFAARHGTLFTRSTTDRLGRLPGPLGRALLLQRLR
jgi:photosystem II stability/assembly factor-like uncharacterized protein